MSTNIEWTKVALKNGQVLLGDTWNPGVVGCEKESAGCMRCYAIRMAWRLMHSPHKKVREKYAGSVHKTGGGALNWTGDVKIVEDDSLEKPLRAKRPTAYFVDSMFDLFHKKIPFHYIDRVFAIMSLCPQHIFQILTKHPDIMESYINWGDRLKLIKEQREKLIDEHNLLNQPKVHWPLPNVWLGTSVENMVVKHRVQHLLDCPAVVRFISHEPCLGGLDFKEIYEQIATDRFGGVVFEVLNDDNSHLGWAEKYTHKLPSGKIINTGRVIHTMQGIHQVITGGESGGKARPMWLAWAEDMRDQCKRAGVAFFMKQICVNGRKLDYEDFPIGLKVREYPV